MWLPIITNFLNILLIIFGSFGAVQCITKYLIAYAVWSFMWMVWNIFLICYYLNLGTLNRESGLLSLGTGSVSWWESNGWGCQPEWGELDRPGLWRPTHVEGCHFQWYHVELGQSVLGAIFAATAIPLATILAIKSYKKKTKSDKGTISRRPVYTIELSPAETNVSESSLKPMTPRRVKRRSGSRGNSSSVRRSRRSYRNAGYSASTGSLPREPRSRPTSAHSSYSNFHGTRPVSYHVPRNEETVSEIVNNAYEPAPQVESVPIVVNRNNTIGRSSIKSSGYDVAGPYKEPKSVRTYDSKPLSNYDAKYDTNSARNYNTNVPTYDNIENVYDRGQMNTNYDGRIDTVGGCESPSYGYGDSEWPPPPAPPYSARATPQAPGPPAYQPVNDLYNMAP
nr:uncharacterized protein LOC101746312 isoform X2 [Bombyx mori]